MGFEIMTLVALVVSLIAAFFWHQNEQLRGQNYVLKTAAVGGFPEKFDAVATMVHRNAVQKGFWKGADQNTPAVKLCLIHSEVSEVMEAVRQPEHLYSPEQEMEELADIVIRVMDYAVGFRDGFSLGDAICEKMRANLSRDRMHGGKRF